MGSGTYYIDGRIDDGKNLPVVAYSAGTVQVVDHAAPATSRQALGHPDEQHSRSELAGQQ